MSDAIGFIVEGVVTDSDTYYHLIGRCCDIPIHIGDRFEVAYAPAKPIGRDYPGLGVAGSVKLRVERIQSYQRQLEMLGEGMTGTIDVRGEGLNRVEPPSLSGLGRRFIATAADVDSGSGTCTPVEKTH